jgi:hypothetical protein
MAERILRLIGVALFALINYYIIHHFGWEVAAAIALAEWEIYRHDTSS